MKNLFLILALACLAQLALPAQAYLPVGSIYTDSLDGPTVACFPYACQPSAAKSWMIPSSFEGIVMVEASPIADYTIIVTTGDDSSRIETCQQLADYAGGGICLIYKYGESSRISVSGPANAMVRFSCNSDSMLTPSDLPNGIRSMANLCGNATSVLDPVIDREYQYIEVRSLNSTPVIVDAAHRIPGIAYLKQ